jgi:hypothetical protein
MLLAHWLLRPEFASWVCVLEPLPTQPSSSSVPLVFLLLLVLLLLLLQSLRLLVPSGPLPPKAASALKAVSQDAMKATDPLAVACRRHKTQQQCKMQSGVCA